MRKSLFFKISFILGFVFFHTQDLMASFDIGYSLYSPQSKKFLATKNENTPHILASVSKMLTFHYVLKNLSPHHKFKTQVLSLGEDLYLKGEGDPFLTLQDLLSLIFQLKAHSFQSKGSFFCDSTHFKEQERISTLGLDQEADNPSFSPLNVEFNRTRVYTESFKSLPDYPGQRFSKNFSQKSQGETFIWDSKNQLWKMVNPIPGSFYDLPIKNSALFTCSLFKKLASLQGIELSEPLLKKAPQKAKIIGSHYSLPILRLAVLGLEYSNNLIAEMLLLRASKKKDLFSAAEEMERWIKSKFDEIDLSGLSLVNGSGLTTGNRLSAKALVEILGRLYSQQYEERSFPSLLSINHHSGGLRGRILNHQLAYHVLGKTGSLDYVSNVAGFITTSSGKQLAFSLLIQDTAMRKKIDSGNNKYGKEYDRKKREWSSHAKLKADKIIQDWIRRF